MVFKPKTTVNFKSKYDNSNVEAVVIQAGSNDTSFVRIVSKNSPNYNFGQCYNIVNAKLSLTQKIAKPKKAEEKKPE